LAVKQKKKRSAGIAARIGDQIRDLISRGVLSPGVHLGQLELAERFGASRLPVREALKLLSAEGIVIHDPNRGFFVASMSSEEARQLYRVRHLLEAELLSTIAWPSAEQLRTLQAMVDELRDLLREGRSADWMTRHREFHQAIFDLSPNKVIAAEVLRLIRLTDRYRSITPFVMGSTDGEAMPEKHLLKALANRDRAKLLQAYDEDRGHIEQQLLRVLRARGL
jgi:DNA-binding GntR family transcriptional regulator